VRQSHFFALTLHVAKVGDKGAQMSPTSSPKRFIAIRAVRRRYGDCSARTIDRWVEGGALPPPDQIINNRRYWDEGKLDEHDRQRTIEAAAKSRPVKSTSTINEEPQRP
jgi:hypothetical protein